MGSCSGVVVMCFWSAALRGRFSSLGERIATRIEIEI
jgi:hypothetical protein